MPSLIELIDGAYSIPLGKNTPKKGDVHDWFYRMSEKHDFYFVTVSLDNKQKVRGRLVHKLPPSNQISFLRDGLDGLLSGWHYVGCFEFTKKGVIHAHIAMAHPHILLFNSLVKSSIISYIRKFGIANTWSNAVSEIAHPDKVLEYIFKEYDENRNLIFSSLSDLDTERERKDIETI